MHMPKALLSAEQYSEFVTNGTLPKYSANSAVTGIPRGRSESPNGGNRSFPASISNEDFWYLYKRCDIAENAVDIIPKNVWGNKWKFRVFTGQGAEISDSELEKAAYALTKQYNINLVFQEAHIYARCIGFGLIVIGLKDGKTLDQSAEGQSEFSYLSVYSGDEVKPVYDQDAQSETYRQIIAYQVTPEQDAKNKFEVHASRCIMVYEKKNSKQPHGVSILQAPYDLFLILKNTDWSAGEAYYQNASPLYELSWDDTESSEDITLEEKERSKSDLEDLNARKRIIHPKSWELKVIQGSGRIADPQLIWDSIIERIAGSVGIPKQLLLGTSAGALASGEVNLMQWYNTIALQQSGWAEPYLNEFYGRLQSWGILPQGSLGVVWGTLWEMDEKEKAQILQIKVSTAVAALSSTGQGVLMSLEEVRETILDLSPVVGGGSKQSFQTNQPEVYADHAEFTKLLVKLKVRCIAGEVSKDEALAEAKRLIGEYVEKRRADALQELTAKGVRVTRLPPEMQRSLRKQERDYLKQFKAILEDALDEPDPDDPVE